MVTPDAGAGCLRRVGACGVGGADKGTEVIKLRLRRRPAAGDGRGVAIMRVARAFFAAMAWNLLSPNAHSCCRCIKQGSKTGVRVDF